MNFFLLVCFCILFTLKMFGQQINQQSTTGPIPSKDVDLIGYISNSKDITVQQIISGVPAYLWHHGCGPTALGMVMGYYDAQGYPLLISGDASSQTTAVDQAIASTEHYNDYASPEDSYPTLLPDKSELPTGDEHVDNSIADYMLTSQSILGNYYGWSWSNDIPTAWQDYIYFEHPTYSGIAWSQMQYYFTFDSVVQNVNQNHPMVFLVDSNGDGYTDHFICAVGYKIEAGINYYGCYDTWDTNIHWYEYRAMSSSYAWGVYNSTMCRISNMAGVNENNINIGVSLNASPNPFSESVSLSTTLVKSDDITIAVYNAMGNLIKVIANKNLTNGIYCFVWDGCNENGAKQPTGLYFIKYKSSTGIATKKVQLVR